jgi:hypothetical protein
MAPEYLHGHILAEPLPYTTEHRLLAEIQALQVEILRELRTQTELMRSQAEIARQAALKLEKINLQVHVIAVQMGRLVERGGP